MKMKDLDVIVGWLSKDQVDRWSEQTLADFGMSLD
jgi:hypothetical protein